eukprot:3715158-Amphidinium_carterae.1
MALRHKAGRVCRSGARLSSQRLNAFCPPVLQCSGSARYKRPDYCKHGLPSEGFAGTTHVIVRI